MVRSSESFFTATPAAAAGAVATGAAGTGSGFAVAEVAGPGTGGAVTAGRFVGIGWTDGLGPKNFAHRMITPKDSREATRIRSSGVNLSFCPGAVMTAPQSSEFLAWLNSWASLPISPESGRNQICARADGSAEGASTQARLRAPRQSVQSLGRHSANMSVQSGNFLRTRSTNTLCSIAARTAPRARQWSGFLPVGERTSVR